MLQRTTIKIIETTVLTVFLSLSLGAQPCSVWPPLALMSTGDPVSAVPNAPLSATVVSTHSGPRHDDSTKPRVVEYSFNVARDAKGRTYNDHHNNVGYRQFPGEQTGEIYDPATRFDIRLYAPERVALRYRKSESGVPAYETNPNYDRTPITVEPDCMVNGEWLWRKEDLGTKTMEGVTVHGVRFIHKVSASQSGTGQPVEIFNEIWYSRELRLNLLVKTTDPRDGEMTFALKHLKLGDPDPALFQVPAEFRIDDISKSTQSTESAR